jgi:hypothetical protein
VRVLREVCDPLLLTSPARFEMLQRSRLLGRSEVATNEWKRRCGLFAGDEHVERLHSECATLAFCAVDDANGLSDSIAVAKRQHRDDETPSEVRLVVQRSSQGLVGPAEGRPGGERSRRVCARIVEQLVQEAGRNDGRPCGGQRVERREDDHAVTIAERRLDHGHAVLGRGTRRRA